MGDDPDSGHPTPRDDFPETSTPVSSHRRVPLREHFPENLDQSALNRAPSPFGQNSPRSRASHTHTDQDIREVIKTERAAIDKKKHEKDTKKLEDSLHESYRHIQDLQFNLEGRDVALEEAKKGLAEKEAEILTKTEEIGRLKQLTELHQQKIAEMQSQFAEEKLKLQESNADLEREQTGVMGCLEKARAELAGLAEEKAKLERRLDDMEQDNRLKINDLTSELAQANRELSQTKTDLAVSETRAADRIEILQTELTVAKAKITEFEESSRQNDSEKKRLEKMHEELSQVVVELKNELIARPTQNELERLQELNRDLDSRLEDKHRQYEELETECSDQRKKLDNTKRLERELTEKTKLIEEQLKLIIDLQSLESSGEKKIQELREQFLLQQQDASEKVLLLEQEKTALQQQLTASDELINGTKKELEAVEMRIRAHDDEKAMIQTKCDRLAEDLEKEKKKIADLESTIDDLAKKELEASGQVETIRKEFAVKQKEHTKMTEDLSVTQQKLAQAKDIITNLEKAAHQNTYDEKKHEELERLNGQLTKDIDYLRGEMKTRPSRAEFQRLHDEMELLKTELAHKNHDLSFLEKEKESLMIVAGSAETLRTDLERKMQVIREQEAEITKIERSLRTINDELAHSELTNAKLVEEFDQCKSLHQIEINDLVHKLETTNESYRALHARMQQQEVASAFGSSTVWELLPESLRKDLPSNLIEALKSLRIDRHDVLSLPDSQTSEQADSCAKVADALENFYRTKGRSTLSYNILQLTGKFLRAGGADSAISDYSLQIGQFIEKREKKLEEQVEEMKQRLNEERRDKFEYHSRSQKMELELDDERRANENLNMNITNLKADLGEARNIIETRQGQLARLQEEVTKLKHVETQYKESMEGLRQVTAMIAERDRDIDEQHDEEMRLHQRLRAAEADVERLKREQEDLLTSQHNIRLENMDYSRRLVEADLKVSRLADAEKSLNLKLEHEVKVKRYNQETMRCCIEYMDQYKTAVEKLKDRNSQRQQVLDKILMDLANVSSKRELGLVAESNLRHLNAQIPGWKRDDDEQNKTIREMGRNYNQMMRDRSTDELRAAFHQVHQDYRAGHNKENQPRPT